MNLTTMAQIETVTTKLRRIYMKDIEALKAFSSQLKKGMGLAEDLAEFD